MKKPPICLTGALIFQLAFLSCEHNLFGPDSSKVVERQVLRDYQYQRNTYFFLGDIYRENYRRYTNDLTHFAIPGGFKIDGESVEVYKAAPGNDTRFPGESIAGWATKTGKFVNGKFPKDVKEGDSEFGHFIRLEKNEYYVENNLGWIRMNNAVAQHDILAVFYSTQDSTFGGIATQDTILLKLIKSRNAHPRIATANLEWKHVYKLGSRNIDPQGFDIKIFFEPPSGLSQETDDSGTKWLQIFGLDRRDRNGAFSPDGVIDLDPKIVDLFNGELHFPDLRPFDPEGYFVGGQLAPNLPSDKREPAIYDTTNQVVIRAQSRFFVEIKQIIDIPGTQDTNQLEILRKSWTLASGPDSEHSFKNKINNFVWYNPFVQVHINDIYPNVELNPNVPNRVNVLRLDFYPDPNDFNPDPNTWGGVMQVLVPALFDQTLTKSIEIMVQGNRGRLHIDLGAISEDVIPNGRLDTEDDAAGLSRNGILDPGEDIGIDGVAKPDPPELNFPRSMFAGLGKSTVPYDFWDVNNDALKTVDEPWSYDNWFYSESNVTEYIQFDGTGSIIGTENNVNDQGGRRPDTEDINGNGFLDRANSFFRFSFSLSDSHTDTSLIVGGNPDNPPERGGPWKLYRIPFDISDPGVQIGTPNPTQIEFLRIWIDSFDNMEQSIRISIAEITFVENETN